jgi:formylglycine-generating enzyme required for sulfatase activity
VAGVVTAPDSAIVSNTLPTAVDEEVRVPPGLAWIGTPWDQVRGLPRTPASGAPPSALDYEAPRHAVRMDGFWIERTEVPNERYRDFLMQRCEVVFTTPLGDAQTLPETVVALVGPRAPPGWDVDRTARQCYAANRSAILSALPGHVVGDGRSEDEDATWARVSAARLPRGIRMRFYDRAPPASWPSAEYPAGRARHPVRGLSLADATAFALWAGRHVPDEVEWEYAARGPRGLDTPWGGRGDLEGRAHGGGPRTTDEEPDTRPVTDLPDGASWVGCLNLLGNVAEWTSSWLSPYPGSPLPPLPVPVDRGGSAFDEDPLLLRPAYRGGTTPAGGARPWDQPRPWVGLRLARYDEPARSWLPAMRTLVLGGGRVSPDVLEGRVYAGVQGRLESAAFGDRQDESVRRGAKSFVVQPLAAAARPDGAGVFRPGVPPSVRDAEALRQESATAPVLLALLHGDVEIPEAWVDRGSSRAGRPAFRSSSCPPGTWLVALDRGHLVLLAPDASSAFHLAPRPAPEALLKVVVRRAREAGVPAPGEADLQLDAVLGVVEARVVTPLGNPAAPDLAVSLRLRLEVDATVTRRVGDWEAGRLE